MFAFNDDKSKVKLDSLFKRVDCTEDLELSYEANQKGGASVTIDCPDGYLPLCAAGVGFTSIEGGGTVQKPSLPDEVLLNGFNCKHLKMTSGKDIAWVNISFKNTHNATNWFRVKASVIFVRKEFVDSSMIDD